MASSHATTGVPRPLTSAPWHLPGVAPAALLGLTVVIGVIVGMNPAVGIMLALAMVFVVVVTRDLALGVCGFLLLTFLDVVSTDNDLSLTKAAGAALAGAWLAALATRGAAGRNLVSGQPWLTAVVIAFLGWSALSATWAVAPSSAVGSTSRFALNALLIPIVYSAVRTKQHVIWIYAVFVGGTLLSVAYGLATDPHAGSAAAAQAGRLVGARVEANVLATLLVIAIVFAGTLALVLRRQPIGRWLALVSAVAGLVALFATLSRGGLAALAAVLVVGVLYGGRWRRAVVVFTVATLAVGAIYVSSSPGAVERLTSGSTSGRADIWTVGWRMVEAHPLAGVGSGNYRIAAPGYLLYPGTITRDDFIIDVPYAAHNIYLHVLAEMGAVGLALLTALLVLCVGAAVRAIGIFRRRRERALEVMSRALVAVILASLVADFFVSEQYNKQLWLLLALCPALLAIAREGTARGAVAR